MQNFRPNKIAKTCLTLLSLTLLTQTVFGYENNKLSYTDTSSYMYQTADSGSILNLNSLDARAIESTFKLDSAPTITNSKAKINMSLRDSDIRQALRMLADKAKVNIALMNQLKVKLH